ncbi:MAG TPA: hypothetical protein VFS00_25500, partial [Polyangiaceae bacterium]|nr:hypothetical protein [Polyangiaceae bacterium]
DVLAGLAHCPEGVDVEALAQDPAGAAPLLRELADRNEATLRARSLDDWARDDYVEQGGRFTKLARDCASFVQPPDSELGLVSLLTLPLEAPTRYASQLGVVALDDTVEVLGDRAFVAAAPWRETFWPGAEGERGYDYSYLLRVDLAGGARLAAGGRLEGRVYRGSLFEEPGFGLRLLAQRSRYLFRPDQPVWPQAETSLHAVRVDDAGERLAGSSSQAFAASFVPDSATASGSSGAVGGRGGYASTVAAIDFASTPPRALRSFSANGDVKYVEMLGPTRLLAYRVIQGSVGYDGRRVLTLYDVSDVRTAAPLQEVDLVEPPGGWEAPSSEFLSRFGDLVVVRTGRALQAFRVSAEAGIEPRGAVVHDGALASGVNVSFDGTTLYTLSAGEVRASDVTAEARTLSTAPLVAPGAGAP